MTTRIASAFAAIAIALSVATPVASAAPQAPAPTAEQVGGSVVFCFNIPLGFFSFSICI
ncbi:hypothetical protein ACQP0C_19060 [Nocardia sp. CA-129566]|uniref:hypothetical protein n=1 Tax=Nocardia sp. CA-129566 TaxID=3239976 RepID=UPI003D99C7AA